MRTKVDVVEAALLGLSEKSVEYARRLIRDFEEVTGKSLVEVTKQDIDYYILLKKKQGKTKSPRVCLFMLKRVYEYLGKDDLVEHISLRLKQMDKGQSPPVYFTEEETRLLLETAKRCAATDVYTGFRLLALYGLRIGELLSLRKEDVKIEGDKVLLHIKGKGGKHRIIEIVDRETKDLLLRLADSKRKGERLFDGVDRTWRRRLKRLMELAGFPKHRIKELHLHSLRHGVAVRAVKAQCNIEEVRQLLGHSRVTTTQIYFQLAGRDAVEAAARAAKGAIKIIGEEHEES